MEYWTTGLVWNIRFWATSLVKTRSQGSCFAVLLESVVQIWSSASYFCTTFLWLAISFCRWNRQRMVLRIVVHPAWIMWVGFWTVAVAEGHRAKWYGSILLNKQQWCKISICASKSSFPLVFDRLLLRDSGKSPQLLTHVKMWRLQENSDAIFDLLDNQRIQMILVPRVGVLPCH